jgi:hypothetical protein
MISKAGKLILFTGRENSQDDYDYWAVEYIFGFWIK